MLIPAASLVPFAPFLQSLFLRSQMPVKLDLHLRQDLDALCVCKSKHSHPNLNEMHWSKGHGMHECTLILHLGQLLNLIQPMPTSRSVMTNVWVLWSDTARPVTNVRSHAGSLKSWSSKLSNLLWRKSCSINSTVPGPSPSKLSWLPLGALHPDFMISSLAIWQTSWRGLFNYAYSQKASLLSGEGYIFLLAYSPLAHSDTALTWSQAASGQASRQCIS